MFVESFLIFVFVFVFACFLTITRKAWNDWIDFDFDIYESDKLLFWYLVFVEMLEWKFLIF